MPLVTIRSWVFLSPVRNSLRKCGKHWKKVWECESGGSGGSDYIFTFINYPFTFKNNQTPQLSNSHTFLILSSDFAGSLVFSCVAPSRGHDEVEQLIFYSRGLPDIP